MRLEVGCSGATLQVITGSIRTVGDLAYAEGVGVHELSAVVLVVVTGWTLANDFVDGLAHHDESSTQTMRPVDAVAPAAQFGLVVFAAFVMLGVTSEYTRDTIRTTLRVVPKRWPMLVVIATVGATVTAVAGFAAVVVSGVLVKQCCTAPRSRAVDAGTGRQAALIIALDGILVAGIAAIVRNSVATLFATNPAARGDFGSSGARVGLDPVRAAGALRAGDPNLYQRAWAPWC